MSINSNINFINSALTENNHFGVTVTSCLKWLKNQQEKTNLKIVESKFSKLENWYFDNITGNLKHKSGKFFSIEGIHVTTNFGVKSSWNQPIINQPEIGFLGIVTKKFNGILHFLLQAKIEPGNINFVQLSPTLQATKSNYTQVHGGQKPPYLELFNGSSNIKSTILSDQLQSEQGARFLRKRNRNIIIEIEEEVELLDNFIWLTLGQIKSLLKYDNVLNMDTRTVISSINFDLTKIDLEFIVNLDYNFLKIYNSNSTIEELIAWITKLKSHYELIVKEIGLKQLDDWLINDNAIYHKKNKYFKVIAVDVIIENREVKSWSQPIIQSSQEGVIGFVVKKIDGVYHFLVQAKVEAGNFDILELAPTVQCLTGDYRKGYNDYDVQFLDIFLDVNFKKEVLHKSYQSEEGGRFYKEQNLNYIVEIFDNLENIPVNYNWFTYAQLMEFIKYNNYLNIQARSLIACLDFRIFKNA